MKLITLFISILAINYPSSKVSPSDFEYKISSIVRNFKDNIMDEDECEKQKREADDLADDIEDAIKDTDEYDADDIVKLKKLQQEAEALEDFIAVIGHCGSHNLSIENFNLINRRVGASVTNIIKNKYCIDVIAVSIDDYLVYLGENNSSKNYTVTYKWKTPDGTGTGNGTMGLPKLSVRNIYDNRDNIDKKKISFWGITCQEF